MCDEARGCHLGTPKWVIFAEYVRFNRAIVNKPQRPLRVKFAAPRSLSAQKTRGQILVFVGEAMKHTARCSAIGPISQNAVPKKPTLLYKGLRGGRNS